MKTHKFTAAAIIAAALCTGAFAQPAVNAQATAPNEVVYVPQLPNASDLTKAASAQGVTVTQIDQTSSQVVVTYKYSNGAVNTVSYQPLANAETSGVPAPSSPAPAVTSTGSTVVYTTTAPAYYYDYPYYGYGYYPWGWYPPVSIGLGFGFHGGFRGGFHGGGRFR